MAEETAGHAILDQAASNSERAVSSMFSCSVSVVLRDGVSARFWTDAWLPEGPVSSFARNLFLAVGRRFHRTSVQEALSQRRWVRHITGPPTMAVLCEYVDLWAKMESVQLRLLVQDRFVWRWTQDGVYSASSAYHSFLGMTSMLGALRRFGRRRLRRRSSCSFGCYCTVSISTSDRRTAWSAGFGELCSL